MSSEIRAAASLGGTGNTGAIVAYNVSKRVAPVGMEATRAAADATQYDRLVDASEQAFIVGVSTFPNKYHHFRQVHTPPEIQIPEQQVPHNDLLSHFHIT